MVKGNLRHLDNQFASESSQHRKKILLILVFASKKHSASKALLSILTSMVPSSIEAELYIRQITSLVSISIWGLGNQVSVEQSILVFKQSMLILITILLLLIPAILIIYQAIVAILTMKQYLSLLALQQQHLIHLLCQ